MKDELLNKALVGDATAIPRFNLISADGVTLYNNVRLDLVNTISQAGTPFNRANILPDEVATSMELADTATPADAFAILAKLYPMFYLGVAPGTRQVRIGHSQDGDYAYLAIRSETLQTRVVMASDAQYSGIVAYNPTGQRKFSLQQDDVGDCAQLSLDDSLGYGVRLGTIWSMGHTETYRGCWIRGQNSIDAIYLGHTFQTGRTAMWMRNGTSTTYQIYFETTDTGPRITLRQPNDKLGLELLADDTNGGIIKLYNAAGVLKQTIQ